MQRFLFFFAKRKGSPKFWFIPLYPVSAEKYFSASTGLKYRLQHIESVPDVE
jgi:hypothetical protein